ncbi:hypothetical protein BURPSS13_C0106 [Burkholderia pseudomallei S13]|nr:hypothetical protein BURPSS13_C0106 [Burkholderia pseudomallei S13]
MLRGATGRGAASGAPRASAAASRRGGVAAGSGVTPITARMPAACSINARRAGGCATSTDT